MLRTEEYDSRHWCQQEVLWADEYATPAVLVEARTNLNHPAGVLPLDRVPSVRIPDGNLVRYPFSCAARGAAILTLFAPRLGDEDERSFADSRRTACVYFPAQHGRVASGLSCSRGFNGEPNCTPRHLISRPAVSAGVYEAAEALVTSYGPPGTRLVTPNTLAATKGATP